MVARFLLMSHDIVPSSSCFDQYVIMISVKINISLFITLTFPSSFPYACYFLEFSSSGISIQNSLVMPPLTHMDSLSSLFIDIH